VCDEHCTGMPVCVYCEFASNKSTSHGISLEKQFNFLMMGERERASE